MGVFGGGGDISPSASDLLDTLVCEVESSMGVNGEVCDEPFLQEVAECIGALCNAVVLGADGITASLFKARLEPATWLHKVILAVWHTGRAPKAWKSALVIPATARISAQTTTKVQLSRNQFAEYPKQGLCAIVDAPLGAVCGWPAT
jgi:hypothetical protein